MGMYEPPSDLDDVCSALNRIEELMQGREADLNTIDKSLWELRKEISETNEKLDKLIELLTPKPKDLEDDI